MRSSKTIKITLCIFCILCLMVLTTLLEKESRSTSIETNEISTEQTVQMEEIILPQNYENINLYAKSAVLIDGETNRILYGKNPMEQMPNASTTKILTCILAIELGEMEQICEVSDYARTMPETKCGFYKGDAFYLRDLLYSLMLESHNDSAVVIAESIGGSIEGFAQLMNEKTKEIGCSNTYFITPNGLDEVDATGVHGASAYDLALIMNYCRKNEDFLDITKTMEYRFSDTKGLHTYSVSNKNSFLNMQSGVLTGKTGFTADAGYCYVCAYQENDRTYCLALLACGWPNNKNYKWQDAKALIAYGNTYYEIRNVGEPEQLIEVKIPKGVLLTKDGFSYETTTQVISDGMQWEMLLGEQDTITTEMVYETTSLPIKKGRPAGALRYTVNGIFAGEQELFYTETVENGDFTWCFAYLLQEFLQKTSF